MSTIVLSTAERRRKAGSCNESAMDRHAEVVRIDVEDTNAQGFRCIDARLPKAAPS